jgi:hypothetical protein
MKAQKRRPSLLLTVMIVYALGASTNLLAQIRTPAVSLTKKETASSSPEYGKKTEEARPMHSSAAPKNVIEVLTLDIKPGRRDEFDELYVNKALPPLRKWNFNVVAHGPSLHDVNSYYIIRSFKSLEDRQTSEDAYYNSDDWKNGPRSAVMALVEHFAYAVVSGETWQKVAALDQSLRSVAVASPAPQNADGANDFDFLIGSWRVHHRRLQERLANNHDWVEFDGICTSQKILGGLGNMDDNVLDLPGDPYRAVTLRAYDPAKKQWSIWWLDSRNPRQLDPPVIGHFGSGVGTFYADDVFKDNPIRVRFLWTRTTSDAPHWEQAFSADGGKTWETNWTMDFRKIP